VFRSSTVAAAAAAAAAVEYPKIVAARAAAKFTLDGPVLLANALTAFALNLVSRCSDTECHTSNPAASLVCSLC
jgi:hypothetical protein